MAHKKTGIRKLPDGRWEVRVSAVDPQTGNLKWRRRRIEGNLREARALREELRTDLRRGKNGTAPQRMRLADFAESWLASKAMRVKPSTAERYTCALGHILPVLGQYYLDAITTRHVEAWVEVMKKQAAAPTVNGWLKVLKACVGDGCAEHGLSSPAIRVKCLPEPPSTKRGLTAEELRRFLDAYIDEETRALVLTLAWTGMRWGEATALRADDVDFTTGVIHIRRAHWRGIVGTPKNGRERVVPMSPILAETLRQHQRQLFERQDAGWAEGWLFATVAQRGEYAGKLRLRYPSTIRAAWEEACDRAEVKATPHDLRRTFVDLLRQAKVDAVVEYALVGHADEKMRRTYSTVRGPEAARALEDVARLVEGG